ncbi:MAG: hypothetical protein QM724_12100 [Flavobacteriales bacterium]
MLRPIFVCSLLLLTSAIRAQDTTDYVGKRSAPKEHTPFLDRLWFGGGLGLNFGTVTAIQLDPLVGIHLDQANKLSTGLGLSYWYYRDNRYTPAYTRDAYGYRVFSRYRVIQQAYLHAEFLHLNTGPNIGTLERAGTRIWVPHLLVGAGYVQQLGGSRSSVYLQVLWEVLQDPNSVYFGQGPIFSAGVGVGF